MLNVDQSRAWEAMGIGPQWLLRESEDPLCPAEPVLQRHSEPRTERAPTVTPALQPASVQTEPIPDVRETLRPSSDPVTVKAARVDEKTEPVTLRLDTDTAVAIPTADWDTLKTLAENCRCCSMASTRHHVVFAEGRPGLRLALVGEAPGSEEDLQGIPFVGKSGQLLTQMLESVDIKRGEDIVIMNVLKCRPPQNRNPAPQEIACCEQFLRRQLALIRPDVILIMGRFACQTLLRADSQTSIGSKRGVIHTVEIEPGLTARAVVSYHPSYLLRSPEQKAKAWEDLLLLKKAVREAGITLKEKTKTWI